VVCRVTGGTDEGSRTAPSKKLPPRMRSNGFARASRACVDDRRARPMTGIDNFRIAGLRRGVSAGLRLSFAHAGGPGMNDTDRPLGPETMR
jgi:hypothetical protein